MKKMVVAKESEEGFSLEAEIVEEIIKFEKETNEKAFLTTEIVDRLNINKTEKERVSNRLISIRVRRLGFVKTRLEAGKRGFEIDFKLLKKLAKHFKLDFGKQLELGEDR